MVLTTNVNHRNVIMYVYIAKKMLLYDYNRVPFFFHPNHRNRQVQLFVFIVCKIYILSG
jgi:hypothetical protein